MRTPLNGVIGTSQILMANVVDDDSKEMIQTITDSGEILLALVFIYLILICWPMCVFFFIVVVV
jgi:signal transduction histidine kinase